MRKLVLIFVIALLAVSCKNKELCIEGPVDGLQIKVVFDWKDGFVPPEGLRANMFSLNERPIHEIYNFGSSGGIVYLLPESQVRTLAYSYLDNTLRFRNEGYLKLVEAYTPPMSRATYSKANPTEMTFGEPAQYFYIGDNPLYDVIDTEEEQQIVLEPQDVIQTYTFRIEDISGTKFISATRGALSGMSSSIFISTRALSSTVSTILFDAKAIVSENAITGSFKTFGRVDEAINIFTIEILYPTTKSDGIMQESWSVTDKITYVAERQYHILITNSGVVVPDEGGGGGGDGGGFDINIGEWGDVVTVDL